MGFEISPAVERAATAARTRAANRGDHRATAADWLLGLLEDDEGKPARLLERLGADLTAVREALIGAAGPPISLTDERLYETARGRSVALRADPSLTTDVLLLAVLEACGNCRDALQSAGVPVADVEMSLRSDDIGWNQTSFQPDQPAPAVAVSPSPAAARAVDANLNRAREALRVIEDYCRFALDDRGFTERTKTLRHRLAAASALLPPGLLLAARDTPGDVGTTVTAGAEYERQSPQHVAAVNLKRLQESLRSAEEFGKLLKPDFGRELERLRYDAYDLERTLLGRSDLRAKLAAARLYVLLTGECCRHGLERTVSEAAAGGAQAIQLREKMLPDAELLARARVLRKLTRGAGVLFVVNDRPDIARLADADGVHLGQDDLPVADARRIVGPDALIGVSTHDLDQVRRATGDGADYIGVGPTFPSRTKVFGAFPGLDFVRAAVSEAAVPAFALGGIDCGTIRRVLAAGAVRVAVSAAVAEADDPRAAAAELRQVLDAPPPME